MALCPNRDEILEAVGIIKPNVLLSVPTLFNRVSCCSSSPPADPPSPPTALQVYDAVHTKIKAAPPLRQKIFHSALAVARERNHLAEYGRPVSSWLEFKYKLADKAREASPLSS
jgi:hypothetical protein